ncbi:hypothetical protein Lal_00043253 [Lupinus albus]|nr:hypothetical protein Lal_00043253 [Lupinus albus]
MFKRSGAGHHPGTQLLDPIGKRICQVISYGKRVDGIACLVKKITSELQEREDRPNLTTRIFRSKLMQLMVDVIDKCALGNVKNNFDHELWSLVGVVGVVLSLFRRNVSPL